MCQLSSRWIQRAGLYTTLLTQGFSFLHFCNHKQNRSSCLQKIYPLSQAFSPVPPVCISKMLWTFPSRYPKQISPNLATATSLSYPNLLYIRNHKHWLSVLTAYAGSLFVDWKPFREVLLRHLLYDCEDLGFLNMLRRLRSCDIFLGLEYSDSAGMLPGHLSCSWPAVRNIGQMHSGCMHLIISKNP